MGEFFVNMIIVRYLSIIPIFTTDHFRKCQSKKCYIQEHLSHQKVRANNSQSYIMITWRADMKFTERDIEEFKLSIVIPWMWTRVITPEVISFTDNMYKDSWVITKEMCEGEEIYSLARKKKQGRKYKYLGYKTEILDLLAAVELIPWEDSSKRKPNLKYIPFSYIVNTAERFGMSEQELPSTFEMEQIKLNEEDEE